ncbi:heterokaryon incompatibility protein-domain-containing protein, partial [Microdochium bolleyi]
MNCQPGSNAERISALTRGPLYEKLYGHRLRLVTIYPGAWADQIRCQLDTFTLHGERLKYQALSYAWGRSMSKSAISLNTYEVFVTTNLELALRLLRHATKEVVLWIDALCINQSDMAERNEQVSRMREIFEGADNVVAFLGHPWMHYPEYQKKAHLMLSQEVVDLSAQLSSASVGFQRAKAMAPSVASDLPLPAHPVIEYLHFLAHLDPGDKFMKFLLLDRQGMFRDLFEGIRILLASAWWTRAWILQEIIVPEKAMILYGTVTFTWQSFYSISASIIAKGHAERLPAEYGKPLRSLAKLAQSIEDKRREWRTGGTTSNDLYSLLRDLGGRRATDDRDHINALLSLVGNGQTSLKPNYFWNVAQVYAAATLDILNRDKGSLRVLRGDLSRKGVHNLPSWVPDWSAPFDDLDRRREELI